MTIQIEDMNWSIYADTSIDSPEDTTTSAPDGDYKVRTEMFDYHGRYVEGLEFKTDSNTFQLTVGS